MRSINFENGRFGRTFQALEHGIESGVAPGMVAALWCASDPDRFRVAAVGSRRVIPSQQPMRVDTIFDLSSLTKIAGTSLLLARLVDRGWMGWDQKLCSLIDYDDQDVTLGHLLSHSAGLIGWEPYWEKLRAHFAPEELYNIPIENRQAVMREIIQSVLPQVPPGTRTEYSDVSFMLLGFCLEKILGRPLDEAIVDEVWRPLGMEDAFFQRVQCDAENAQYLERTRQCAATELCPWRGGVLQGQVHDDNAWAMGGYGGHAGMFGSARDLMRLVRGLNQGFLSSATLSRLWTRVGQPAGSSRTLGWDTPSGMTPSAGPLFSSVSVGHLGFTGTSLWIDLGTGVAVALLTNRVHPSRDNNKIREFRPRLHEAIRVDLRF